MYNILFHLCGVTILEICFFFYYVGPIETEMFKTKILILMDESANNLYMEKEKLSLLEQQVLQQLLTLKFESIDVMEETLLLKSEKGEERRISENNLLFVDTAHIWFIGVIISVGIFIIIKGYKRYYKSKNEILTIKYHSCSDLELNKMEGRYRKNSIDYDENEEEIENNKLVMYVSWEKKKKILNYLGFAGLLILFQYFFFKRVIFYYKPLSLDEIRYILFTTFKLLINNDDNIKSPSLPPLITLPPSVDILS